MNYLQVDTHTQRVIHTVSKQGFLTRHAYMAGQGAAGEHLRWVCGISPGDTLRAVTCAPWALTFGAVRDLARVVEQAELHPANPLSAPWTRQLPATARHKQTRAEPSCFTATKRPI